MSSEQEPSVLAERHVGIWRDVWLSSSETFIRDQVAALRRWQPVRVGLRRLADPLVRADLAPLSSSWLGAARAELVGALGHERQLASFLTERGVSVLHAHFGPAAIRALPVARRADLPLIATFHGYDVTRVPQLGFGLGREYRRRLRGVFSQAERLVCVSEFIAEALRALGAPEHKISVHYVGVDVVGFGRERATARERSGITFVGRLVTKKGVDDLLEAVRLLPTELRERTPVRIVGTGPLQKQLQRRAADCGADVRLLGYRTSGQIAELLSTTAVFCAPSRTAPDGDAEGFGMVFLEAALQGAPAVAYAHGGVQEAVVDGVTGLLAAEGDVTALSGNLRTVLSDPQLAGELGHAGRARVLADFDIRSCTAALERVYDEVSRT